MAHLFSIPENVLIQHLFTCLDHNDILRLRRVSKQTKAFADAYLWTPLPGHQGKWELEIDSSEGVETLEAFLQMGLPPPSRLHIANRAEKKPAEKISFFEDDHLEEFMERYGKYVTNLRLDKLFIPFTSAKEIRFYESLINLKKLRCFEMITVGGAAGFKDKTKKAEGSFLIRPTFKNLKIFKLDHTDCMDSMWNFINGVSNNLEELLHPFKRKRDRNGSVLNRTSIAPLRELIERRSGINSQTKLLYDWRYLLQCEPSELLQVFASCRNNGVMIKKLHVSHLDGILLDEDGRIDGGLVEDVGACFQRNKIVGSILQSLDGVNDAVFCLELPALEEVTVCIEDDWPQWPENGYPEWSNLKKMDVHVGPLTRHRLQFLQDGLKLPKLEELALMCDEDCKKIQFPIPRNLGVSCGHVKKLVLFSCPGDNQFFLGLWKELPLLEDIALFECPKLTNKGFVGDGVGGSGPTFLNLKKLKHLTIWLGDPIPRITDAAFKNVFRHLKLTSFEFLSDRATKWITISGVKALLTGPFAETIQRLHLNHLKLKNVSEEELKQVVSCFRSSKMV